MGNNDSDENNFSKRKTLNWEWFDFARKVSQTDRKVLSFVCENVITGNRRVYYIFNLFPMGKSKVFGKYLASVGQIS